MQVVDGDDVTLASRIALSAARSLGARPEVATRLDLVVRELAWNLVRHAQGGLIRFVAQQDDARNGLLIESRDRGHGISSLLKSKRSEGLGFGLSLVQRHSDEFTLQSTPGEGTCIRSVMWWPSTSS